MYSAKINGERVQFGTSGLLYNSNKLMYDRGTNTLWRQFTGEPVVGRLADSGIKLEIFPVVVTTWAEWLSAHPDTTVLDINTGFYRPDLYGPESDPGSIYYDYFNSQGVYLPLSARSDLLEDKAVVLGLRLETLVKAYPLERLVEELVVNDELAGTPLVVVADPESRAARAYRRGSHQFTAGSPRSEKGLPTVLDENGDPWEITEEALVNAADRSQRLDRLPGHMAFWFGWFASFPLTGVYGEEAGP